MNAVVDGHGPVEFGVERTPLRDVDAASLHERMRRPAAGAGENPHPMAGLGELFGDRRADRPGSGDDV